MLTVACVLRAGGLYDVSWVARLRAQVRRHLKIEHRFHIICDSSIIWDDARLSVCGGDTIHTVADCWPGWWAKLELFKPDRFSGPVLYFDLDTLLIGDLSEIASAAAEHDLIMLRDFCRPGGLGSGVMAWRSQEAVAPLYGAFTARPRMFMECHRVGGDQEFIEVRAHLKKVAHWQDVVPGQIVSYKADACERAAPAAARVMCLHGKPKFTDMPADNWARREWEMACVT